MPKTKDARDHEIRNRLFELLLGAELVGVSALALSAVGGTGRKAGLRSSVSIATRTWSLERVTYVALAADHLVAVELAGERLERGLNDATAEAEDEVEGRLLWQGLILGPCLAIPAPGGESHVPSIAVATMAWFRPQIVTHLLDVVV